MRLPRILVAHPGRQHSDQLAWALHDAGMLGKYIHGSPLSGAARAAIPPGKRLFLPIASIARRLARPLWPRSFVAEIGVRAEVLFDWTVARLLVNAGYDAIVGYEVASAQIAAAAKRLSLPFVLDATSVHHTFQDAQVERPTRQAFHSYVCARKDWEIAAADLVLTCSRLAASTYIAAGVDRNKITPICLGATAAVPKPATLLPIAGLPKLLFVGRITRVKGIDLLLDALEQLATGGRAFETTVVANLLDADPALGDQLRANASRLSITVLQPMPPSQLAAVYRSQDILVLPSRFDSFGLVVAEALSHGCGVVVSPNVGASMLVQEPFNGMTLKQGSSAELAAALSSIIDDISSWRARRDLIRQAAEAFEWHHYRGAVARRIAEHLSTDSGKKPSS